MRWLKLVRDLRYLPAIVQLRADRWLMDLHRAHDFDGSPMCMAHGWAKPVDWPCRDWMEAADRVAENPAIRMGTTPPA